MRVNIIITPLHLQNQHFLMPRPMTIGIGTGLTQSTTQVQFSNRSPETSQREIMRNAWTRFVRWRANTTSNITNKPIYRPTHNEIKKTTSCSGCAQSTQSLQSGFFVSLFFLTYSEVKCQIDDRNKCKLQDIVPIRGLKLRKSHEII